MSIFNREAIKAMTTGRYTCSKCGGVMEFEDEWEDSLICLSCGHDIDLEHYGFENEEDYDALYPTKEDVLGCDINRRRTREMYDEVCGELDNE